MRVIPGAYVTDAFPLNILEQLYATGTSPVLLDRAVYHFIPKVSAHIVEDDLSCTHCTAMLAGVRLCLR